MQLDPTFRETTPFGWRAHEPRPGEVVLTVHGELDLATAPELELACRGIEALPERVLVVDLRGLDFIDLAGARCLVAADARARAAGRTLQVLGGPGVRRLFALAGLDRPPIRDG